MLISVIITTFNHENYISKTISSVLSQKQNILDIELIIGDDCSSDNTYIKIKEAIEMSNLDRVVLKKNKHNLGVSQNIFNCINIAKGDYICFLDGDDYWTDNRKLENQIQIMQEKKVDFVFDGVKYIDKNDKELNINYNETPKNFDDIFLGKGYIHTSSTMYSKKALERIKITSSKFLQNDIALLDILFWLSAVENLDFFYNEKVSTAYRKDISSMSNSNQVDKLLFMNKNILTTLIFFFKRNKKIKYLPTIIRRTYLFFKFSLMKKNLKKLFVDLVKIFTLKV